MAKLGSDFRSTTPTDNDYVRRSSGTQTATELRDLKTRVKAFFGRLFDTDTGDLADQGVGGRGDQGVGVGDRPGDEFVEHRY